MTLAATVTYISLGLVASAADQSVRPSTPLVELTAVNFDQLVTNGSVWFVMLYSPSCGHCKRMTPTLEQLARDYVRQPQQ
jgi:thioredoxin domain-containing protein 5